ncbi:unnamed protein product [Scytosiphon promiscuus]
MDRRPPLIFKPGSEFSWRCLCRIASVFALSVAGGVGLIRSSAGGTRGDPLSTRASAQHQKRARGTTAAASRFRELHTTSRPRRLQLLEDDAMVRRGGGMLKLYTSFAKYALESSNTTDNLPLPLATPIGEKFLMSIPLITIIGVQQKGGTTNLRRNLMTHPLVTGMPNEVHFFDQGPDTYPKLGQWPGDGRDRLLGPGAVGRILSEYAKRCLEKGKPKKKPVRYAKVAAMSRGLIVESSPRYILSPLAPYRMKMVRPRAKLVVVLRDPTERYFSQLRMVMCKKEADPGYSTLEEQISMHFHAPGQAKAYIERGEAAYQPYSALCRGENATSADLWGCYMDMATHNPLHRGLYADQLERWFRVYDRSQILVVDSAEMFVNFTATVASVAQWAGLPEHEFEYDRHQFEGTCTGDRRRRHLPDFFAQDGRYEAMLEEEELFREWYRPHNERLESLLGREMMW